MAIKDLLKKWEVDAKRERTAREYAVRLPLKDAAQIHALAEMHPGMSEEDIVTDLLSAALEELERTIPYARGTKIVAEDDYGDPIFEDAGLSPRLKALTKKYLENLRAELENRSTE